jgi:hypothetical protein
MQFSYMDIQISINVDSFSVVKKLPAFMKVEDSLQLSLEPVGDSYPQPTEASPHPHTILL